MKTIKTAEAIQKLNQSLLTIGILTSELIRNMDLYDAILKELKNLKDYHVNVEHQPVPVSVMIKGLILDKIILVGSSILEEADQYITAKKMPDWKQEIQELKIKVGPIRKKLSNWSDLRKYRNQILAHNLRKTDGTSIFDTRNGMHEFNVPKNNGERVLFFELIRAYTELLFKHFIDYQNQMNFETTILDCIQFSSDDIDLVFELREIENFRNNHNLSNQIEALSDIPSSVQTKKDFDDHKAKRSKL